MTDHVWPDYVQVHAHLGMPGDVRCFETFGPSPLAVAITAQLHALSRLHPPGTKIVIGRKWVARINQNAENIAEQSDGIGES